MSAGRVLVLAFSTLVLTAGFTTSQDIDGCPLYGCRPSGTFSIQQNFPRTNASIKWVSDFFIGPVPRAQGCVGNSVQLICQSNGPAGDDTGYMSISLDDGKVAWRDPILRFPSLPLLATNGDVIGSDGNNLVHYDSTGKLVTPVIPLEPRMHPLFSLKLVGETFVLLVSEDGLIALKDTVGRPVAELVLNGTVERVPGTFIPVASPVSNGNRFYLLTQFVPESDNVLTPSVLGLQRLYAIDVFDRMNERTKIAWYANFEREQPGHSVDQVDTLSETLRFYPRHWRRRLIKKARYQPELLTPSLLWDKEASMIFVSLPPPEVDGNPNAMSTFWGLKDTGTDTDLVFHTYMSVTNMVLFEIDATKRKSNDLADHFHPTALPGTIYDETGNGSPSTDENEPYAGSQLWVSLDDGKICAVERNGNISKTIDLAAILKVEFKITSKMVTIRSRLYDEDTLIFGIKVTNSTNEFKTILMSHGIAQTNATTFLVAMDTPLNADVAKLPLWWMVPTPDDTVVTGQIVGVPGTEKRGDQIVYFGSKEGAFSKVVSVA